MVKKMENTIKILGSYKQGSRTGNISMLKENKNQYQIYVDWDDSRYNRILLFSGKLKQCVNLSMNRFGIKKQILKSLKIKK